MGELLSVKNINVYYGSIHAIKDVSFHVDEGEIVTLIGANGAGKTTTMHAISGLLKLTSGEITYDGNLISKMEAHKIVRLGLAQVPEGRRVFSGLTVQQNLSMGAYTRHDGKDAIQSDYDMVFDLLPRLKERRNQPAGTLSGGEQQMLAVGRALMCKPKILLLDEPSMGLSPLLVKEIFKIIRDINRQGVTVLLVEQNAKMALDIANRAYVLETGTIKMDGAIIRRGPGRSAACPCPTACASTSASTVRSSRRRPKPKSARTTRTSPRRRSSRRVSCRKKITKSSKAMRWPCSTGERKWPPSGA